MGIRTFTSSSTESRMNGSSGSFKVRVACYHWSRMHASPNTHRKGNANIGNVPRLARPSSCSTTKSSDGRPQVSLDAPLHAARTLHVHEHRVTNTFWFSYVLCPVPSTFFISVFVRRRGGLASHLIGTVVGHHLPIVQSSLPFQAPWRGPIGDGGRGSCA